MIVVNQLYVASLGIGVYFDLQDNFHAAAWTARLRDCPSRRHFDHGDGGETIEVYEYMNQIIDVSIPRLLAPVDVLKLERRVSRRLQRASTYTVAEVLLAGWPKLNAARNIGVLTAHRILGAVASYVGLPEQQLLREISSKVENSYQAWDASICVLELSSSTLTSRGFMGLFRIRDLITARATHYDTFVGLGIR